MSDRTPNVRGDIWLSQERFIEQLVALSLRNDTPAIDQRLAEIPEEARPYADRAASIIAALWIPMCAKLQIPPAKAWDRQMAYVESRRAKRRN